MCMDEGSLNPATAKKNAFDIYDYIFKLEEQVRSLSSYLQATSFSLECMTMASTRVENTMLEGILKP